MKAPMHFRPQSAQNHETFSSSGTASQSLSMADISQQTFANHAYLRPMSNDPWFPVGSAEDVRPGPCHLEASPGLSETEKWLSPEREHQLPQQFPAFVPSSASGAAPLGGCIEAAVLERRLHGTAKQAAREGYPSQWEGALADPLENWVRTGQFMAGTAAAGPPGHKMERQTREEELRFTEHFRDHGAKDEGTRCTEPVRSGEEFDQVHAKWQAAEERIKQLEGYIKDCAAKHALTSDTTEKDREIRTLRQVVLAGGIELQQAKAELQAARSQSEQKIKFWEQGASRLLHVAEQFLGQHGEQSALEFQSHENGHFESTATKVSLTLSNDKNSLRRMLKDALAQTADTNPGRTHREKRKGLSPRKEPRASSSEETASEEGKPEECAPAGGSNKSGDGDSSTAWSPSLSAGYLTNSAALSDSNASSRNTSPGLGQALSRNAAFCRDPSQGLPFIARLAGEIRQLLAASQRQEEVPHVPLATKPVQRDAAQSRLQDILDGIAPARKGVATTIITAEKILRSLEHELRKQCEEILGSASLDVDQHEAHDGGAADLAAAAEAKQCIPLGEDRQVSILSALRNAQRRSSALLAQFVQLPQKVKSVFDITKQIGNEVHGLVPISTAQQAEARASQACMEEQRQSFHVDLLQKRVQTLSYRLAELGGSAADFEEHESTKEMEASKLDTSAASRQIQEALKQGISQEEQLFAARTRLLHLSRQVSSRDERTKSLEKEVVDLHLSRHNERAQFLELLQQSAGFQKGVASCPWPPLVNSLPGFANEAGSPVGLGSAPTDAECQER